MSKVTIIIKCNPIYIWIMFCILQYTKNDKKCKCILHIICMCAIFYGYQYIHISCIGIFQICALNYYLYIYLVISHCYILDFTF